MNKKRRLVWRKHRRKEHKRKEKLRVLRQAAQKTQEPQT